ncbi:hypothetical protein FKM82_027219 [Ascaphus truei]
MNTFLSLAMCLWGGNASACVTGISATEVYKCHHQWGRSLCEVAPLVTSLLHMSLIKGHSTPSGAFSGLRVTCEIDGQPLLLSRDIKGT